MFWPLKKKSRETEVTPQMGENYQKDLDFLLSECKKKLPKYDEQVITKAFHWCYNAHKNKVLKSGMPYYTHPLAVALIVINEIPLDDISVVAALLHNVTVRGNYTIKDIQSEFGKTIAVIVEGIEKIQKIENHKFKNIENYRRLLLSLFKDIRIILVRIADRLHNMRTLSYVPLEKQLFVANEVMEIYAPFAHRFGIANVKWELEDLAFKYLNPRAYDEIRRSLAMTRREREDYIKKFIKPVRERLANVAQFKEKNIKYEIHGRPKHIYSIYNKMLYRKKSIDELYDLYAVRIILDTDDINMCFLTYGLISEIYKTVPNTFKNYISTPKRNGYQSLHSAFFGPTGKMVEVQIRTLKMHKIAEKGVAAHFKYKSGLIPADSVLNDENIGDWMKIVRDMFENVKDYGELEQIIDSVKNNIFMDEIFVITPKNEFKRLPKESTPLDFAYYIHTDIGYHCIGAKVNGKIAPLDYKLRNGDQVEILTSKNQKPVREWLDIVVTHKAKSTIQKVLAEEQAKFEDHGKRLIFKLAIEMKVPLNDDLIEGLLRKFKIKNKILLYRALGSQSLDLSLVYDFIKSLSYSFTNGQNSKERLLKSMNNSNSQPKVGKGFDSFFRNTTLNISYADCCNPLPGDPITGVITPDNKLYVHRKNCKRLKEYSTSKTLSVFDMEWSSIKEKDFITRIKILTENNSKIISEITSIIMSIDNISLRGFNIDTKGSSLEGIVTLKVKGPEQLDAIFSKLSSVKGIKLVERALDN